MLISKAMAQPVADSAIVAQEAGGGFVMQNILFMVALFAIFYLLLIRPQQKRMKEHKTMLDSLKVGENVVTAGGLIGKITKLASDTELEVDLGSTKVRILRSMVSARTEAQPASAPAPVKKKAPAKKAPAKKTAAKKTTKKKA